MRRRTLVAALAVLFMLGGAVACTSPEERAEQARGAVAAAIEQGDRDVALEAIDDLREVVGDTADAQLELAQLLVHAGNAPEAGWLLESTARRHPVRSDVALALARVSLLLGNPARAREVADGIGPDVEQHPDALVLRAQAELQLGDLERALATLAEVEERYPERPESRLLRITTLISEDMKDEARAAIEQTRAGLSGDDEETVALRRRLDLMLAQLQAEQGGLDYFMHLVTSTFPTPPRMQLECPIPWREGARRIQPHQALLPLLGAWRARRRLAAAAPIRICPPRELAQPCASDQRLPSVVPVRESRTVHEELPASGPCRPWPSALDPSQAADRAGSTSQDEEP